MRNFFKQLLLGLCINWLALALGLSGAKAQGPPLDQPAQGGQPLSQVEVLRMPPVDIQKLLQEDEQRAIQGLPPRFAQPIAVRVSPATHGTWESLDPQTQLWRLRIVSAGAVSLNLGFTRYVMPPGGRLFLYTPDYSQVVGPFTDADNEGHGQLWTPLLPGEEIVIEVTLPAAVASQLELNLTSVNHGYTEFGRPHVAKSGACNVDVICPAADNWRDEIRSVAVYSTGGSLFCSGSLLNNTAQDLAPYFLTADHCGIDAGNAPSLVVYWNYENSTCRTPGSPQSGQPGDGVLDQFNTGAIFRAGHSPSDMTLVELDDPIDSAFNVHWAGWDNTSANPISATAIHHPNTDEKRISFENDPTTTTSYGETNVPGDGTHIRIIDWDLGTTEPGSSGSPLFNQAGRVVGQLHGGGAACGNDLSDWYGRLSISWLGGGAPNTRLRDWLDPGNTGATVLDGRDEAPDFNLTVTPTSLDVCQPDEAIYEITVGSILGFTNPVTLSLTGNPGGTNVIFSPNPVTPPDTSVLALTNTALATPGSYNLNIVGLSVTTTHTSTVALNLAAGPPDAVNLLAPANEATNVSTSPTFTWSVASQATTYRLEVATDIAFNTLVYSATVAEANHTAATSLAPLTTHYWRVIPQNGCGSGNPSPIFSFTAGAMICRTPDLMIPDGDLTGVSDDLMVSTTGLITDIDVFVEASHSYVGDLKFTLAHTATSVTLIDRPGFLSSGFGCSGANIETTLDDEANLPVEDQCADSDPTIFGTFKPDKPLSAFDDHDLRGIWRLTVSDHVNADTGALVKWCLLPTVLRPSLSLTKTVEPLNPTPGQVITYTIIVANHGNANATQALISDTLSSALTLAGPITVDPPGAGILGTPPILASQMTITTGRQITLTFPVTVTTGLPGGTIITNTATISSDEVIVPVVGTTMITISGSSTYLPSILKN